MNARLSHGGDFSLGFFSCRNLLQALGFFGWSLLFGTVSYTINSTPLTQTNPELKAPGYIDNDNFYDLKHTGISDETIDVHTEPVIFEPIRNIKLNRATYKVTVILTSNPI